MTEVTSVEGKQRFLVLARPEKPLPQRANVQGSRDHFQSLRESHGAAVYPFVQDNGIGTAIIINVDDHDELTRILSPNPLGSWGNFEVFPISSGDVDRPAAIDPFL